MAKTKALLISGPMDAKHVGGVDVSSSTQPSMLDSYFANPNIEPDELPSHTFVAHGNVEVPRRADTITSTIRRPSTSIKRSLSKLRAASIAQLSDLHLTTEAEGQSSMQVARSGSTRMNRPLKMQSSMSRLRQKVGLDRDVHANAFKPTIITPEPEHAPKPLPKDITPLPLRRPLSRLTLRSASSTPEPDISQSNHVLQRGASSAQREPIVMLRQGTLSERKPLHVQPPNVPRPTRPKRADSGTAIDLDDIPVDERPLGFKEILAVQSFAERMRQYERAREYWAHADHGLMEWTESVTGSRIMKRRR